MSAVYGVCVGSWDRLLANVVPRVGNAPLLALSGQTSIAATYNTIMTADILDDADALILLHDDLEILDPNAEAKILVALSDPDVGAVGVAGARDVESLAWWDYTVIGHQQIDSGMIDFDASRTGDVDILEGSLLALSPAAFGSLWFDDRDGFHGYDGDLALKLRRLGLRSVVIDLDTHHHTRAGFTSDASAHLWREANERFTEAWNR